MSQPGSLSSCQPCLHILAQCTSHFFFRRRHLTIPSGYTYIELNPWWACFLSHSLYITKTSVSKSFSHTFWTGVYLARFPFKFVSQRILQVHRPASKIFSSIDIYYLAFPDDPIQRKILVYAVYAAELTQTILLSKMAYTEFAAGFGNFQAINNIGLLWFAVPTLSSIGMILSSFWPLPTTKLVAAVVQIFYASRIKLLADSYTIPIVIVFVSCVFLHLEWLVLIFIVLPGSSRRRIYTGCNFCTEPLFLQTFGQEIIDSSWRMYSKFFIRCPSQKKKLNSNL